MNGGLYVLLLRLLSSEQVRIGALGCFALLPGWYLYVGSAQRHRKQRVMRHLGPPNRKRWHIDYLTTLDTMRPLGAVLVAKDASKECALNRKIGKMNLVSSPIARFGASDCQERCPAHLWFCPQEQSLAALSEYLQPGATPVRAENSCPAE